VNRNYATESGERREEVTFIDVTLWGRVAEIVGEYCKKGRPLFVEGRLQLDTWDDKQTGQKRSKLKVVGENIQLLGGRDSGGAGGGGGGGGGGEYGGESGSGSAPRPGLPADPRPLQNALRLIPIWTRARTIFRSNACWAATAPLPLGAILM
jgi:single-strand DNA-binding protein